MVEPVDAGPSLRAAPFGPGIQDVVRLLSPRQRSHIASIATNLHLPPQRIVYREGTSAHSVFIIGDGAVKAFRDLPSGKRRVMAFHFADDVFGLAHGGQYVGSVQTITAVRLYRIRVTTLSDVLRRDADLAFQFLCKVAHELRGSLRHTVIVARRDAVGRVTMFLRMLEQNAHPRHDSRIEIPMSRSDAADYLGLSLESVSRALTSLERSRVIALERRHEIRVLDRTRFEKISAAL
jgi:CRP-like cAMP-binding protein